MAFPAIPRLARLLELPIDSSVMYHSRVLFWLVAICAPLAADDQWPQFRGPGGRALGDDKSSLPAEFGPKKALRWKTDLPLGHGSPCIWGDRIFVTAADAAAKKIEVIALNRKSGEIVWRQPVPVKEFEDVHATSSLATSTPVTDGERIYVNIGSYGMLAYDWNGKVVWEYPMGPSKTPYGAGTSPVLSGDLLIFTRDCPPAAALFALRKKDGTLAWKKDLVIINIPGPRTAHSTPLIWNNQIVLLRAGELAAHSPRDGAQLWSLPIGSSATTSPTPGDGVIYVSAALGSDAFTPVALPPFSTALEKYDKDHDGKLSQAEAPADDLFFRKRTGVPDDVPGAHFTVKLMFRSVDQDRDGFVNEAEYNSVAQRFATPPPVPFGILSIRPEGSGTLAPSAVQWAEPRGAPEVTTPLEYRGRVYAMNSGGIITCIDAKSGKTIFRGRVNAPGAYYSSPVAGGGKVFVASTEGIVTVLAGGEKLEILSNNDLGEPVYGTPALIDSTIYIRSARHLWAFGNSGQ